MITFRRDNKAFYKWRSLGIIIGVFWSFFLIVSSSWNVYQIKQDVLAIALAQAQVVFEKDLIYRSWNAQYGGVYVPVSSGVEPNPYLAFLPERDVVSETGEEYTLINPAYMTRLVNELEIERDLVFGHITSLNPLNPNNVPDAWESNSLHQFEQGLLEASSVGFIEGKEYMRLMRPVFVEGSCLRCHEDQGYQLGDVRGGISVSVPMSNLREIESNQISVLIYAHIMIWVVGLIGWFFSIQRLSTTNTMLNQDVFLGCYNRHYFFKVLATETDRSLRYKAPLSVIMLDIDGFKRINDTYGHLVGDEVLKHFVQRIQTQLRQSDLFARYGGDEFSILLPETKKSEAADLAERLRDDIENYVYASKDLRIAISSSFGVTSVADREAVQPNILLEEADQALYRAKGMGKNRVAVWEIRER